MNTTTRSIALGAGVALVIIAGFFGWQYFAAQGPVDSPEVAEGPYQVPPMAGGYTNDVYRFSFSLPQSFSVREMEGVVVIENAAGDGVQVLITPIEEDIPNLTAEIIQTDIPDLAVREPEVVEIGEGRTGLAFLSDNEAFDGASREVWFVFGGSLYQISTYERLDPLVQAIFRTWEFF